MSGEVVLVLKSGHEQPSRPVFLGEAQHQDANDSPTLSLPACPELKAAAARPTGIARQREVDARRGSRTQL